MTSVKKLYITLILVLLVAAEYPLYSQVCNGEIVKFQETFGNGTARASLPTGRTNYIYNGTSALADGDYALYKTTQAKPEWHNSPDHTGGTDGRMMVTNASFPPGEFYRDTVFGLSSTSTFAVYFYAMNVNTVGTCSPNPILPQLQLVVESYNTDGTFTQISSMVSSSLPQTTTPTWVKISGQFFLPIDVTAVRYRIINNSTGGCGNDLAIDDITFSQCDPVALPLSGFALRAALGGNAAKLTWSTLSENNTDKFVVQRSVDNKSWKDIATVNAAGQSNAPKQYTASDDHPYLPVCFYRITSVDVNGQLNYSNTAFVQSKDEADAKQPSAYPNPFSNTLTIEMFADEYSPIFLRMYDLTGRLAKSVPWTLRAGANSIAVSGLDNLPSGIYFLEIVNPGNTVLYKTKMLKQ